MTGAAAAILTGCRHRCGATGRAGRAASELLASGSIAAFFLLHSFQLCWCRAGLGWAQCTAAYRNLASPARPSKASPARTRGEICTMTICTKFSTKLWRCRLMQLLNMLLNAALSRFVLTAADLRLPDVMLRIGNMYLMINLTFNCDTFCRIV